MTTQQRSRISGIDAMRALAALAVFFCHLVAYWGLQGRLPFKLSQITELGMHGVDFFVVISGFCLGLPVARAALRLDLRKFFIRRALRIAPPYYVALAACSALAIWSVTWHHVVSRPANVGDVVLHAFAVQNLVPNGLGTINGSFWSIALEAQLYLCFPLLVLAWRRFGLKPVLIVAAIVSVVWEASWPVHWWIVGDVHVLPDRMIQFAAGVFAAQLIASGRQLNRRGLWLGLILGLAVASVASTATIDYGIAVLWTIPSVCGVLLAANRFRHPIVGAPLERLGLVSFSFYLLQQPVLLMTAPLAYKVTSSPVPLLLLGSTVCLALVIGGSVLLYLTVEAPSIRLGSRLTARRPLAGAAPITAPVEVVPVEAAPDRVDAPSALTGAVEAR